MAGQSFAMGEAFGKGFQYGKRRVSSMTNEQFNASSAEAMFAETTADITAMIPTMKNAMERFHTLQTDIILKMIDYIAKLPADVLPAVAEGVANIDWVEIIKAVTQTGGNVSQDIMKDLIKGLQVQQAHASLAPQIVQTPFTSDNIKIQNEIESRKEQSSPNPNISKTVISGNIKTTYNNQGKIVSQEVIDKSKIPVSQTAQSTRAQTIVKDFTPTKLRPPRSIQIQYNKYKAEIESLKIAQHRLTLSGRMSRNQSTLFTQYAARIKVVANLRNVIKAKYDVKL